jgi:hypothetical protein
MFANSTITPEKMADWKSVVFEHRALVEPTSCLSDLFVDKWEKKPMPKVKTVPNLRVFVKDLRLFVGSCLEGYGEQRLESFLTKYDFVIDEECIYVDTPLETALPHERVLAVRCRIWRKVQKEQDLFIAHREHISPAEWVTFDGQDFEDLANIFGNQWLGDRTDGYSYNEVINFMGVCNMTTKSPDPDFVPDLVAFIWN